MRKFEFQKSYEEIEIAGNVYKMDFSDQKVTEYQQAFEPFYKKSQEIADLDVSSMSADEQSKFLDEQRQNMRTLTELLLGPGTFDELYEKAGKSTVNYMDLLLYLTEIMNEKADKSKEAKRSKYVKKK